MPPLTLYIHIDQTLTEEEKYGDRVDLVESYRLALSNVYKEAAVTHNAMVDQHYPDSGFDVYHPVAHHLPNYGLIYSPAEKIRKTDFKIKCAMYYGLVPVGFYMYPRSSLSKTRLRLANSVGIIDSGYRGNLAAMFDVLGQEEYKVEHHQRLVQICSSTLMPFKVVVVESLKDLSLINGQDTERGEGGFGSTG